MVVDHMPFELTEDETARGDGRPSDARCLRHAATRAPRRPLRSLPASEHARYLDMLRAMPPFRLDRIQDVRREIEAGTYETEERWSKACDRIVRESKRGESP